MNKPKPKPRARPTQPRILTPKQRVAVAVDVLQQLAAKKYIAEGGFYIIPAGKCSGSILPKKKALEDVVNSSPTCYVCVLGATLASRARLYNSVFVGGRNQSLFNEAQALRFTTFGKHQENLMEVAFEGGLPIQDKDQSLLTEDEMRTCEQFYTTYEDDHSRLRAIMVNIIENGGEFHLEQEEF